MKKALTAALAATLAVTSMGMASADFQPRDIATL